jgi:hypothetical protein
MSFVDHYLPYLRQQLITCLSSLFFYEKFMQRQLLAPSSLFLWFICSILLPLLCVPFQFLIVQFFFLAGQGFSLSRGLCWFIPGMTVGIPCDAWCSPVGLPDISQASLELASGGTGALLFMQCNVAWRSFVWARGSVCQSFDSSS